MIKGLYQINGKLNNILFQLLKADVTIGELDKAKEVAEEAGKCPR